MTTELERKSSGSSDFKEILTSSRRVMEEEEETGEEAFNLPLSCSMSTLKSVVQDVQTTRTDLQHFHATCGLFNVHLQLFVHTPIYIGSIH